MSVAITNGPGAISRIFTTIKNSAKKNSPELLVIGGTVAFVATLFSMYKTTLKTKEIVDDANDQINAINNTPKSTDYTDSDAVEDIKQVKRTSAKRIVKAVAPTALLAMGTISCFWGADFIRKQRHAALFAAAEMTMHSYDNYRKGVIEKYGPEVDKELKYKLFQDTEIVEEEDPKTGKPKKVKKKVWRTEYDDGHNMFSRVFDSSHPRFFDLNLTSKKYPDGTAPDGAANLSWVLQMEKVANQELRKQGYLTLNEVYKMLEFEAQPYGANAGWIFDPTKQDCMDNAHVNFGIFNMGTENLEAVIRGKNDAFWIDFNIDTLDVWEAFDTTPTYGLIPKRRD